MNKKIMGVTISLLIVTLLVAYATPVMATTSKKVVAVFSTTGVITDETNARVLTDSNGIIHVWGALRTASATLKMGEGPVLTGSVIANIDYIMFPDMTVIYRYRMFTVNFEAQEGLNQEGSFAGTLTYKADLKDFLNTFDSHAVLQGSGEFEGYTLHLNKEPGEAPKHWVLIP